MFTASINVDALRGLISAKDPICGMDVDPTKATLSSTHAGKTYYFCAEACKTEFDADPDAHTAET